MTEEKHIGHLVTFWFSTFAMLFRSLCHDNTQRWTVCCYNGLHIYPFRDFLYYHMLCVRNIPTYRVYRLYDIFIIQSVSDNSLLRAMVAEKATLQLLIARSLFAYCISYSRDP